LEELCKSTTIEYRVKYAWSGATYYFLEYVDDEDAKGGVWENASLLVKDGWEFVSFAPMSDIYLQDSNMGEAVTLALYRKAI
jgi:hypothetical protein